MRLCEVVCRLRGCVFKVVFVCIVVMFTLMLYKVLFVCVCLLCFVCCVNVFECFVCGLMCVVV